MVTFIQRHINIMLDTDKPQIETIANIFFEKVITQVQYNRVFILFNFQYVKLPGNLFTLLLKKKMFVLE